MQSLKKTATPALFAKTASRGKWKLAPHLLALDRAICDALTGRGPDRIAVTMPPRHGKSEYLSKYVPAWHAGSFPDKKLILASYADGFAARWGRQARNTLEEWGPELFNVQVAQDSHASDRWAISGRTGGMRTVGVGGSVTGEGADLLIVDDPVKNAAEADSSLHRNKVWDWWQGTLSTRLEPGAVAVVLHTRWHHDDLIGRLLSDEFNERHSDWHLINFPAIAEEADSLGRQPGEALWAERFDVNALKRIEQTMGPRWWNAQYQQRPTAQEGDLFKRSSWNIIDAAPRGGSLQVVRYWDKAATQDGGCFTVGTLMLRTSDGLFYVLDVVRGQWSPTEREKVMLSTARMDFTSFPQCVQWIEEEGGSGGKESAQNTIRMMAGMTCKADRVTGSKEIRWQPWAGQVGAGNVFLVRASWNRDFIDEHAEAPYGTYKDQLDSASGAMAKIMNAPSVDLNKWLEII